MNTQPKPWFLGWILGWLLAAGAAFAAEPGAKLWEFPVGAPIQSSPALGADGTIYFGADNGAVYALTAQGKKKWEFRASGAVAASPAVAADGTIYITATDRILYALKPDGTEKWRLMPGSGLVCSPAVGPDGTVFFGSIFGQFFAIDPQGYKKWDFPAGGNIISSPAIDTNGIVYFGCYDTNFYALDQQGTRKWRLSTDDRIGSSPAIGAEGNIYFGSFDTYLHVVSTNGERLWEYRTGGPIRSSPVLGKDGTVYIGSDDKKLHAIGPDAKRKWEFATEGWVRSTPAIGADGLLHFGSYDGKLYAVGEDGNKRWEFVTGGPISTSPAIGTNGAIYFGSWDQKFYAVQGTATLAASPWPMFHRDARRTGSTLPEDPKIAAALLPPEPEPTPDTVAKEDPKIILPPVKDPTFTNRVPLPPVKFADITATPRDLILSNETIFIKPPPRPVRPPIERIRNDRTKPKIEIRSPNEKERFTNPLLVVEGTARDNEGLERVEYRFNGGETLAADGVAAWTIRLHMHPGRNTLQVRAVDLADNNSDWLERTFDYLITSPLLLQINGGGEVTPNLARDLLEIGKTYTITAEPGRGSAFVRWTGGVNSDKPRLEFVMRTNLVLIANFGPKSTAPKAVEEKEPARGKQLFNVALAVGAGGTVKPDLGRKQFELGQTVTLSAKPAKGYRFAGWQGDITGDAAEVTFVVRTNLAVRAEFAPGPFAGLKGNYEALIWDAAGLNHENTGLLALSLGEEGEYKGKLIYAGASYPLEGRFEPDGLARKMVLRTENQTLMLELQAEIGKPEGLLKGMIRQPGMAVNFTCARLAPRAADAAGRYTLLLVGVGNHPGPAGDGCATATVSPDGAVSLAGSLSDGTPVEWSAALHPDGRCPVYVPLYGGRGSLSGWLQFAGNKSGLDISGQLAWFKPESSRDKLYPQGFSRLVAAAGNRYQAPGAGGQLMAYTNAVLAFSEGNLPENLGSLLEFADGGRIRVTVPTDNKFHFAMAPATGAFSGVFTHPATRKSTTFHGVVLQKHGWGSGHFAGPEQSGLVFFGPNKGLPEEKP